MVCASTYHEVAQCGRRKSAVVQDVIERELDWCLVLATLCSVHIALASRIIEVARSFVDVIRAAIEENGHLVWLGVTVRSSIVVFYSAGFSRFQGCPV